MPYSLFCGSFGNDNLNFFITDAISSGNISNLGIEGNSSTSNTAYNLFFIMFDL